MNPAASPQEAGRTGAFASLWLMLRQIFALMFKPGFGEDLEARMQAAELEAARTLLAQALAIDPALAGLGVDDFEIGRLYNASGAFDPDYRLKASVLAARYRTHLLHLRRIRLVREARLRIATRRGICRARRRRWSGPVQRRRTALRACARSPKQAAPRAPIPP